jgi:hypothetical protein
MKELMDLENLVLGQFQELFDVIAENGEYEYSENGLNISAKSSDGNITVQVSYEAPNAKSEAQDFQEFIKNIDDDLFTDVCESLGGEQLSRIANCLNSNDVEAVRSAVLRFKQELRNVLVKKINFYKECLNNLDK